LNLACSAIFLPISSHRCDIFYLAAQLPNRRVIKPSTQGDKMRTISTAEVSALQENPSNSRLNGKNLPMTAEVTRTFSENTRGNRLPTTRRIH